MFKSAIAKPLVLSVAAACLVALPGLAEAEVANPWQVRAGVSYIVPKSDNGTLAGLSAEVSKQAGPSFNVSYFLTPNIAADLLLATPFRHDVSLNGTRIGDVEHLPPVLSLQYHFAPQAKIRPYVGAGVNYTFFMHERAPALGNLKLEDSVGLAMQAGVDFAVDQHFSVGVDARYIDISSEVTLNGANIGTAHIDPMVYSMTMAYRF